jgi:hypothetical protein
MMHTKGREEGTKLSLRELCIGVGKKKNQVVSNNIF